MIPAPLPLTEEERLRSLDDYQLIEMLPEESYNEITRIASELTGAPVALINIIGKDYQYTKARFGCPDSLVPREYCVCAHAILNPDQVMVVTDTRLDERFFDNPYVMNDTNPAVFYTGIPLKDTRGNALGTLCVTDSRPRHLSEGNIEALKALARLVETHFEMRKVQLELKHTRDNLHSAQVMGVKLDRSLERLAPFIGTEGKDEWKNALQATESLRAVLDN